MRCFVHKLVGFGEVEAGQWAFDDTMGKGCFTE
jgi:hypothetical protein